MRTSHFEVLLLAMGIIKGKTAIFPLIRRPRGPAPRRRSIEDTTRLSFKSSHFERRVVHISVQGACFLVVIGRRRLSSAIPFFQKHSASSKFLFKKCLTLQKSAYRLRFLLQARVFKMKALSEALLNKTEIAANAMAALCSVVSAFSFHYFYFWA